MYVKNILYLVIEIVIKHSKDALNLVALRSRIYYYIID